LRQRRSIKSTPAGQTGQRWWRYDHLKSRGTSAGRHRCCHNF
jgi:hypothetical protein